MKKIIAVFIVFTMILSAQVRVLKTEVMDLGDRTIQPVFSADGKYLLFASSKGLQCYDMAKKTSFQIAAAGTDYSMDIHGNVRYRVDTFDKGMKMNSVYLYNINTKSRTQLLEKKRLDVVPKITETGIFYIENNDLKNTLSKSTTISKPVVFSYDRSLLLLNNGATKKLRPLGNDKFYIWPSISPDNSKMCFVDKNDLYVTDLNGSVLISEREARAPRWSPDNKWIVFMRDFDDGHQFTASEIFVLRVNDGKTFQLTNTEDRIEMFPSWSPDGRQIICEDAANDEFILLTIELR